MRSLLVFAVLCGALGTISCGQTESTQPRPSASTPSSGPNVKGTRVTLPDGSSYFGDSVGVDVRDEGAKVGVEFHITAKAGVLTWTSLIGAPEDVFALGTGAATIGQVPMSPGIAYVEQQKDGTALAQATSGEVRYTIGQGMFEAAFDAVPTELSAKVSGTYGIRCWVPPDAIGAPQNGYGIMPDGAPMKQLVLDEHKQSTFCSKY